MQKGTRKITRYDNKNGVGYKNGIWKGQVMLVTFFLSGAYHEQITQIFHGIQGNKLLRKIGFIFCVFLR